MSSKYDNNCINKRITHYDNNIRELIIYLYK